MFPNDPILKRSKSFTVSPPGGCPAGLRGRWEAAELPAKARDKTSWNVDSMWMEWWWFFETKWLSNCDMSKLRIWDGQSQKSQTDHHVFGHFTGPFGVPICDAQDTGSSLPQLSWDCQGGPRRLDDVALVLVVDPAICHGNMFGMYMQSGNVWNTMTINDNCWVPQKIILREKWHDRCGFVRLRVTRGLKFVIVSQRSIQWACPDTGHFPIYTHQIMRNNQGRAGMKCQAQRKAPPMVASAQFEAAK